MIRYLYNKNNCVACISALLIVIAVSSSFAQTTFNIKGEIVTPEGSGLPGATVFIHELNMGTTTNEHGFFEFNKIKRGSYHLHIQYIGFESVSKVFQVSDKDVIIKMELKPSSLELKAFVIEESTLKTEEKEQSLSVEVVDQEFLQKNSGASFIRSLEKLPGINSINVGTGISKPVIRGMSFNRVVVAENGIKQEGQQWGADHGLEIDQFNVERVEVIKGPAALLYGSDGIGGVINIRPPVVPLENTISSSVLLTGRSNNDLLGTSAMMAGNKKGNIFRFRFSSQDYSDYKVPADTFIYNTFRLPIINNRLKNTAGNERNFSTAFGLNRNWGYSSLSVSNYSQKAGFFAGAHGIPRAYQLADDGENRNIDFPSQQINHFKVISNSNLLLKKNWLEVDLGFQRNHRQELSIPHNHGKGPQPEGNLELDFILSTFSGNARYHFERSEKWSIIYGVSAQHQENKRAGFQFLLPNFRTQNVAAFSYFKYRWRKKLNLNAGIRYDYTVITIEQYLQPVYSDSVTVSSYMERNPDINKNFGNFSGGAGLSWLCSDFFNFKLNIGTSFRTPTPNELSSNGIHHGTFRHEMGDSSLTSERGYQLDLAFYFQKPDYIITLSPFFNYFNNYLYLAPSAAYSFLPDAGQVYQYRQTEAVLTGGEIAADYHLNKNFHLGLGGEYVWAQNIVTYYPLPFTPPASVNVEGEYEIEKIKKAFKKTYFNINVKRYDSQNRTAQNEPSTPGYTLINFSAGTHLMLGKQSLKIIFQAYNITDRKYLNHLSRYRILNLPEPGRNFQLTLILPLEKQLKVKDKNKGNEKI